jgi:hypothetical protein
MNRTETNDRQYPLANDSNGNPIDIPPEAVSWRLRKLASRAGRPKMIYDVETGRPLELPLTISFSDFAESVNEAGRYRLEAVDGQGRLLPACIAIVQVIFDDEEHESAVETTPAKSAAPPELLQLISQLVDTNSRVMQAMASAFGQVNPMAPQPIVLPTTVAPAPDRSPSLMNNLMNNPMVAAMLEQFLIGLMKPNVASAASPSVLPTTPSA